MSELVVKDEPNDEMESGTPSLFKRGWISYASTFGIPAIFVILLLGVLLGLRDSAETFMANLANLLPVGYAFGAGMVASVNPCGFFMLPSYISYHLGTEEAEFEHLPTITRLRKALLLGSVVTLGFISVFSVVGSFIAAGGQWLVTVFPYAGVAIGVIIVLLGIWLLVSQRTLGILAASRVAVSQNRSHWNVFLFGVVYAIGSLSCTLPIFLVVVGGSLASSGISTSIGQFISYALGMGMILVLVTIGSALFQDSVAKWLRRAIPYVHRASAMFLVGAGAYLIYYWLFFVGLSF